MINENAREIVPDILYELKMLRYTFEKLMGDDAQEQESNCYLESFLIHARNLLDFFVRPSSARKDDVIARHFFEPESRWEMHESNICRNLQKKRITIHKTLAHISYSRTTEAEWDIHVIFAELEEAVQIFKKHLGADPKSWFHSA